MVMKSRLLGAVCACVLVLTTFSVNAAPVQWKVSSGGNGNYYELIVTNPGSTWNWGQANSSASSQTYLGEAGHLATITSQAENDFILTLDWTVTDSGFKHAWIGGFQPSGSGEPNSGWQWVTGEAWAFENWSPGEPNNQQNEDFLIYYGATDGRAGMWNDEKGLSTAYVVEFEVSAVPVPAAVWLFGSGLLGLIGLSRRKGIKRMGNHPLFS